MSTETRSLENTQKALTRDLCCKVDSDTVESLLQVPIKQKSIQLFLDFNGFALQLDLSAKLSGIYKELK
jgi:hypothetical protein